MDERYEGNSDEYRAGWYRKDGSRLDADSPDERRGGRSYWGPGGHPVAHEEEDLRKTKKKEGGDYLREYLGAPFRSENERYENPGLGRNYFPRDAKQEAERAQYGDRSDPSARAGKDGRGSARNRREADRLVENVDDGLERRRPLQ